MVLGIPDPRIPQLLSFPRHGHGASERIGGTFVVVETREIDNGQGYSGNHGDSVLVVLMLLRGTFLDGLWSAVHGGFHQIAALESASVDDGALPVIGRGHHGEVRVQ